MASKYIDITSIVQVIGCIFKNPKLLSYTDKYKIIEDDFSEEFHKIVFGSIYNLYQLGVEKPSVENILDYLSTRPKSLAVFQSNDGEKYLKKVSENSLIESFDYYYNRMKKMTILRAYEKLGLDLTFIYDPDNIFDTKKKQIQEDFLDNATLGDIVDIINKKIDDIKIKYADNFNDDVVEASTGIFDLIDQYKKVPDVGLPLYGPLINTVTRGARLKKFYLRSAATGVGKSRTMIADACYIGCDKIYDENFGWISNGKKNPVLYITTEQELSEVQSMMLAFLSNVNESHILRGKYENGEEERVREAAKLLEESPIFVKEMPDFSIQDIENAVKIGIRDLHTDYIFLDYIHSSLKILEEVASKTNGIKLREDNVLFMISIKLKDIANQYGVFIMSATQLSGDWKNSDSPDQNLLRGAKSIADKIDAGLILLNATPDDIESLKPILKNNIFAQPTIKISIYKNRGGEYKGVYLWCSADLGVCRVKPMFCTTWNYELQNIKDLKICVDDEEEGAF